MAENNTRPRKCSFCGRGEDAVSLLFPSVDGKSYICDGCVTVCSDFLDTEVKPLTEERNALLDLG